MRGRLWHQISLVLPLRFHDLITGQLALLGFEGFRQEDDVLLCYIGAKQWSRKRAKQFAELLSRFKKEFPSCDLIHTRQTIREQNWNARWERSIGLVDVTPRMVIKPSWKKLRKTDRGKLVLHIDPKMSFGTGHHESTRLCLALLETYIRRRARVLDMGCGTGILAIAAAKLGSGRVKGIDNDAWAVTNARENVKKNRVSGTVTISKADALGWKRGAYDLILSNIDFRTNLRSLSTYRRLLHPGGVILLSGLLVADLPQFLKALPRVHLVPVEFLEENEWVAIALAGNDAMRSY